MLNNADLQFPSILDEEGNEVQVTHGRYISLMESRDRRVRHDAFKAVYQTYQSFRNTFASTLSGIVKRNNFYAQVRGYRSARHAALSDNHIPEAVYDQLVQTVNEHLPLLHRYVAIRKKALGLDELHIYDLFPPLVKDVDTKVTYDKAREILLKAMKPLGDEYISVLREAFQNRWVDVYENKGKRSGAYSSGSYLTSPYILLNWQDKLNDLFTLAHEFGHSVHSYFTRKNQPYIYGDYSIFVAEVASTCNENLLQDYLLKNTADKNMRLYLINHYLDSFRATVYRQTMFAEFEQIIHEMAQNGEPLTAETFTSVYYDLNKKYFGDGMTVDPEIGFEWARIPHFYYNFYVYQYATGFSAATALSKQILQEGAPAVKRYLDFLKAGSSDTPIEVLKKAGVDMTSPEPIRQAFSVFKEKLDELEQLLFG
jgi:oligoendopeptidase F